MPYLGTAQEWLTQSTLLLQARPSTTRITTKYTLLTPSKSKAAPPTTTESSAPSTKPDPPRATLTLKTYDPRSGSTLKYKTTKAAEVSRLIQILGRLARPMAGLPVLFEEDISTAGGAAGAVGGTGSGPATPAVEAPPVVGKGVAGGAPAGAGGKKSKKKGGKK